MKSARVYLWKQATKIYYTASTIVLRQLQLTNKSNKSLNKSHCDPGGDIRSSQTFLSAVVLAEQVRLEPFLEGGETVSVSDGGGKLIPPLGGQTGEELVLGPGTLERWEHQTVVRRRP